MKINIGKWKIIKKNKILGQGGSGNVSECYLDNPINRYAIKQLRYEKSGRKKRFEIEIETNLFSKDKEDFYKTMPMIDYDKDEYNWYVSEIGVPSLKYINDNNLNPFEILVLYSDFLKGIKELHKKNIYHRDIKPDNILFYRDSLRIIDFGIAYNKNINRYVDITEKYDNKQLGAKFTMAPEMRRNPSKANPLKADIYSLIKTLWILISGNIYCFDGQYNPKYHSLKKYFNNIHIIDIDIFDEMLFKCTSDIPEERIDIQYIINILEDFINLNIFDKNNLRKINQQFKKNSLSYIRKKFPNFKDFSSLKLKNFNLLSDLVNYDCFNYSQTNIKEFKNKNIDKIKIDGDIFYLINDDDDTFFNSKPIEIKDFINNIVVINENHLPFSVFLYNQDNYILFMCHNTDSYTSDYIFSSDCDFFIPEKYLNDEEILLEYLKEKFKLTWAFALQHHIFD